MNELEPWFLPSFFLIILGVPLIILYAWMRKKLDYIEAEKERAAMPTYEEGEGDLVYPKLEVVLRCWDPAIPERKITVIGKIPSTRAEWEELTSLGRAPGVYHKLYRDTRVTRMRGILSIADQGSGPNSSSKFIEHNQGFMSTQHLRGVEYHQTMFYARSPIREGDAAFCFLMKDD